jgi:hypothetical protein
MTPDELPTITRGLDGIGAALGILGVLFALLAFALMMAWLFVPFAIFGMKKRLDRIGDALERIAARPAAGPRPGEDIRIGRQDDDIFSAGHR